MNAMAPGGSGTELPIIDVGDLASDDAAKRQRVADAIGAAARDIGFFYVANHPVPAAMLERVYARSAEFHAQPLEWKMRYYIGRSTNHRGYAPVGEEGDHDNPNHKSHYETFDLALDLPADDLDYLAGNRFLGPNPWPDLTGWREDVATYYDVVLAFGRVLMRGFERDLGLDEGYFDDLTTKPTSQLRLLHYVENNDPMSEDSVGIGAHNDFECFTILSTGGPGLQVMNRSDQWIDAPPVPGCFTINIGDMLEAWTNGTYKATPHRVVNTGRERYSLPLFYGCDYDAVVEPLPAFVQDRPADPKYQRIIAGEHLEAMTVKAFRYLYEPYKRGELKLGFEVGDNPFKREAPRS